MHSVIQYLNGTSTLLASCRSASDSRTSADSFLLQLKSCGQNILVYKDNSCQRCTDLCASFFFFSRKLLCHQEATSPEFLSSSVYSLQFLKLMQMYRASLQQPPSGADSTSMGNNEGANANKLLNIHFGILHRAPCPALPSVSARSCLVQLESVCMSCNHCKVDESFRSPIQLPGSFIYFSPGLTALGNLQCKLPVYDQMGPKGKSNVKRKHFVKLLHPSEKAQLSTKCITHLD